MFGEFALMVTRCGSAEEGRDEQSMRDEGGFERAVFSAGSEVFVLYSYDAVRG